MNQAKKIRQQHRLTRAKIVTVTGLCIEHINEMYYEGAYDYLRNVLMADDYGLDVLPKTSEFWAWWRTEWHRIDVIFLNNIRTDMKVGKCTIQSPDDATHWAVYSPTDLAAHYIDYHEANHANVYINSAVMQASYHQLIKKLAKKRV